MNLLWLDEIRDTQSMDAALLYAANGWRVFPCLGKAPALPEREGGRGLHDATTDAKHIAAWWARWPHANIGWALPAGTFALDVDASKGGIDSLRALERAHAPLPFTLRQVTGSGGEHWIFRIPDGVEVRQLSGFAPGLDTRVGGKGYLVVAPSVHPETHAAYRWHSAIAPVDPPAWLVELVRAQPQPERKPYVPTTRCHPRILDRRRRYAEAVLAGEARAVAESPAGSRNSRLNKAWWRCAQFRDVLERALVEQELLAAAVAAGLPEREARRVLR